MEISRRKFLWTGGSSAAAMLTGCDALPKLPEDRFPPFWGGDEPEIPWVAPSGDQIDLITHVINRLTYGPRPSDYARVRAMGSTPEEAVNAFIEEQLDPAAINDARALRAIRKFESLREPAGDLYEHKKVELANELTSAAILRAFLSRRQLYELMVEFWTDHFNINILKPDCIWLKTADDRDVIRANAMGSFPAMLRASALSPAMLWYLDGRSNVKQTAGRKPNENYARELLELHTLGADGGYMQTDVMELARCLTGWSVYPEEFLKTATVRFNRDTHDDGAKEFLGHRIEAGGGKKDLDRALELIQAHPSTARHIATKLCRKFIAQDPPQTAVAAAAEAFANSGGDIKTTLRAIFAGEDFRAARGTQFKRPFHFVISALRTSGAASNATPDSKSHPPRKPLVSYLAAMGQAPFVYPTPDGYPEEPAPWMGGLLWRWNFAEGLAEGNVAGTTLNAAELESRFGGRKAMIAHLLGRQPVPEEVEAAGSSEAAIALALASPAFQKY